MWNYCNANTVHVIHIIIYIIASLYLAGTTVCIRHTASLLPILFHKMSLGIADLL